MRPITSGLAAGAVGLALALGAAAPAAAGADGSTHRVDVTVIGTTDLHGNVLNWDYFKDAEYDDSAHNDVGLAKVSTVVERIRAERGREATLLIDNGDVLQGTPLAYHAARVDPAEVGGRTHPMAAAMNTLDYDAVTVGNHEFNYGLDLLGTFRRQLEAPLLGANVTDATTGRPYFRPYTLHRVKVAGAKPVRVAVVGVTTPGSAIWDKGNVAGRLEFGDTVAAARRYVAEARAAGADLVVVSAHTGAGGESSYGDALPHAENTAERIAREVPGVDAVLYGHTHREVAEKLVVNEATGEQVLTTQPLKWGQRVSVMDFALTKVRGEWRVTGKRAHLENTAGVPEDPAVVAAVRADHEATVGYVNTVVGTSVRELSAAESRYRDTAILDFINDVQTQAVTEALAGTAHEGLPVLSIAAPFSRTARFPAGEVTIKDLAGLYVYDNTLEAVELTGAQLREYLEYSARYFVRTPVGAPVDPEALTNAGNIPDYNYDVFSGIEYDVDVSRPAGERITRLVRDGRPVADTDRFVVAVNNYRRSGGGGFPHVSTAPVVHNAQQEIRQLLIDSVSASGVIDPADFAVENWRLVREGQPLF